jgi:hypothetical protein
MKILNHVHILNRLDIDNRRCGDPHCDFICTNQFARGRASRCGVCGINELVMNARQMKLAKPRCESCSDTREARGRRDLGQRLESALEKEIKL